MTTEMKIDRKIYFISNMATRLAGNIAYRPCPGRVIQVIPFIRQIKTMVLAEKCHPWLRMQSELGIEIVDILPPYLVDIAKIIVTERKKLVERIAAPVTMIFIPEAKS